MGAVTADAVTAGGGHSTMPGMDVQRRAELAETAAALLPEVEQVVVEAWDDLVPAARGWAPEAAAEARQAVRAVLDGLVTILAQGDLDDRAWQRLHELLNAGRRLSPDEVHEVMLALQVTGIDWLLEELSRRCALNNEERWDVTVRAQDYADRLSPVDADLDAERLHALLADLQRSGPDFR